MDIKKICRYPHNRYSHGYGDGYEVDIYLVDKLQGSYYLYPTSSLTSLVEIQQLSSIIYNFQFVNNLHFTIYEG